MNALTAIKRLFEKPHHPILDCEAPQRIYTPTILLNFDYAVLDRKSKLMHFEEFSRKPGEPYGEMCHRLLKQAGVEPENLYGIFEAEHWTAQIENFYKDQGFCESDDSRAGI